MKNVQITTVPTLSNVFNELTVVLTSTSTVTTSTLTETTTYAQRSLVPFFCYFVVCLPEHRPKLPLRTVQPCQAAL